jgi:hypothetical protein
MEHGEHLFSAGHLAQEMQMSVYHVRLLAEELGVTPAIWLNEVDYYGSADVLKMHTRRAEQRQTESLR